MMYLVQYNEIRFKLSTLCEYQSFLETEWNLSNPFEILPSTKVVGKRQKDASETTQHSPKAIKPYDKGFEKQVATKNI